LCRFRRIIIVRFKRGLVLPTVLRIGGYRFFFYANENSEPVDIHIQRERMLAKFWLDPVSLASSTGFAAHELNKLFKLVEKHQKTLLTVSLLSGHSELWTRLPARRASAGIVGLCQMSATQRANASVAPSGLDCQCLWLRSRCLM